MNMIDSATRQPGERAAGRARPPRGALPILATVACLLTAAQAVAADRSHGLTIHGDLKYPPDFEHFDYASPDAIKGGTMTLDAFGTYDSVNPFILKGQTAAAALRIYDTLTVRSGDEPSSSYGLLAENIEIADDKSWIVFHLRPEARWHDGEPVTADDVVWTFDTIKRDGHPRFKSYWAAVSDAEKIDERTVKFNFSERDNTELPSIIGELPVLPKHFWADRDFTKSTLEPLLGSGPYRFGKIDAGRSITLKRVEDYWGKDLPVNVGHDNVDRLRYIYFRDSSVAFEAFKAGNIDFRLENQSRNWATGYDFPAVRQGRVVKEELPDKSIPPLLAFIPNNRKSMFADPRVREALGYAYDFEWMNKNLQYGYFSRSMSYFQNSDFMATGVPEGDELALLEEFRDELPPEVFDEPFTLPKTDGSGNLRPQYREALKLFREAGWEVQGGKLTNVETGEKMAFELLLGSPTIEKIALNYRKALQRIGVDMKVRVVDSSQYQKRVQSFDFDMIYLGWAQSHNPGNEQYEYWGSRSANEPGSANYAGIANPVIDALIKRVVAAESRERLNTVARAMDRVLLHNHYVIPTYYLADHWIAYWDKFDHPDIGPENTLGIETWWVDPDKAAKLKQ